MTCAYCDSPAGRFVSPETGEALCNECAREVVRSYLKDLDDQEERILRRRAEDCLRKNPQVRDSVITDLIVRGQIRFDDLI